MRALFVLCLTALASCGAHGQDLFAGVFESETRENFGTSTPGEYRIEVVARADNRYEAGIYHRGKLLGKQRLVRCPVESEDYLNKRPPGRAEVLCADEGRGASNSPVLSYSENGVSVRAVKSKYVQNPELVKQDGLKPGDPAIFEERHHKTKYYARITWFIYGFRKVSR